MWYRLWKTEKKNTNITVNWNKNNANKKWVGQQKKNPPKHQSNENFAQKMRHKFLRNKNNRKKKLCMKNHERSHYRGIVSKVYIFAFLMTLRTNVRPDHLDIGIGICATFDCRCGLINWSELQLHCQIFLWLVAVVVVVALAARIFNNKYWTAVNTHYFLMFFNKSPLSWTLNWKLYTAKPNDKIFQWEIHASFFFSSVFAKKKTPW